LKPIEKNFKPRINLNHNTYIGTTQSSLPRLGSMIVDYENPLKKNGINSFLIKKKKNNINFNL